jgi:hypothetical protein
VANPERESWRVASTVITAFCLAAIAFNLRFLVALCLEGRSAWVRDGKAETTGQATRGHACGRTQAIGQAPETRTELRKVICQCPSRKYQPNN